MMNNEQISSAIWFAIGLMILFYSLPYGIGGIRSPGTGFLPFLTGVAICVLASTVFITGTRSRRRGVKWINPFAKVMWSKPLTALAALLVYAFILNPVGFIPSTALLVGFLLRVIQPQSWLVVLLGAILTSLVTYLVFQVWLGTQLPAGLLGF
jgi:putative tricarboxylic transport membrane protein